MKTNEKIKLENENIDYSICKLINYEMKRYKSKGYGLIFAWIGAISYILFFPKLLSYYWPDNIKNPGLFYGLTVFAFFNLTLIITNIEYFIYYYIEHPFLEKYKTIPEQWPWKQDKDKFIVQIKKGIKTVSFNSLILLPLFLLPNVLSNECPHRYDIESFPNFLEILAQIITCMLIEDFIFYMSHRLLHTDYFYSKIHKVHHEFKDTVAISALYAHPIEYILGNIIPSSVAPLLLGDKMHFLTYLVYMVMVLHETHDGHSGYTFSWSPHRVVFMTFDADFHIFHHWKFKGNYANYFSIWDRCFGTVNKTFLEYFKNKDDFIKRYNEMNTNSELKED